MTRQVRISRDEQLALYQLERAGRDASLARGAGEQPPRCPFCGVRHTAERACVAERDRPRR